jgi:hypothetical protein
LQVLGFDLVRRNGIRSRRELKDGVARVALWTLLAKDIYASLPVLQLQGHAYGTGLKPHFIDYDHKSDSKKKRRFYSIAQHGKTVSGASWSMTVNRVALTGKCDESASLRLLLSSQF